MFRSPFQALFARCVYRTTDHTSFDSVLYKSEMTVLLTTKCGSVTCLSKEKVHSSSRIHHHDGGEGDLAFSDYWEHNLANCVGVKECQQAYTVTQIKSTTTAT